MGNCSTENSERLAPKINRQVAQAHFQASVKLDHYQKRQPALKKQAFEDMRRLISTANDLIRTKQEQTMNQIQADMKKIEANEKDMKKLFNLGISVQEYVGLEFTQENIAQYKQRVHSKFTSIRQELEDNMNTSFLNIRSKITQKMLSFQTHPELKKEQVDAEFYKWRLNNRQKCKQCILELQNQFKNALTHDYFRKRLKHVVSIDDLKLALKRKPMASLKEKKKNKSQVSKTEVKMQEVEAFEIDTKCSKPGKGWFCCMPTQSTQSTQ